MRIGFFLLVLAICLECCRAQRAGRCQNHRVTGEARPKDSGGRAAKYRSVRNAQDCSTRTSCSRRMRCVDQ